MPAEMRDVVIGSWKTNFATRVYRCWNEFLGEAISQIWLWVPKLLAEAAENLNVLTVPTESRRIEVWCYYKFRSSNSKSIEIIRLLNPWNVKKEALCGTDLRYTELIMGNYAVEQFAFRTDGITESNAEN